MTTAREDPGTEREIPWARIVTIAALLILVGGGAWLAILWPETRDVAFSFEGKGGTQGEVYLNDTRVGSLPCTIPLEIMQRHLENTTLPTWPPTGAASSSSGTEGIHTAWVVGRTPGAEEASDLLYVQDSDTPGCPVSVVRVRVIAPNGTALQHIGGGSLYQGGLKHTLDHERFIFQERPTEN
ncbi:MAG: hypothetical protein HY608_02600 [Planctomycetes bacterium]|nr:hypothetical protein [Planctomycetota bacterium]